MQAASKRLIYQAPIRAPFGQVQDVKNKPSDLGAQALQVQVTRSTTYAESKMHYANGKAESPAQFDSSGATNELLAQHTSMHAALGEVDLPESTSAEQATLHSWSGSSSTLATLVNMQSGGSPDDIGTSRHESPRHDSDTQMRKPAEFRRKLVALGDEAIGKTCLLKSISGSVWSDDDDSPTVCDNYVYVADVEVDGRDVELLLWDTGGYAEHERFRPLSYDDSHAVLICFSICSPSSLENVHTKYLPEVLHFANRLPRILVGLQEDTRDDQSTIKRLAKMAASPVTQEEGWEMAQRIGATAYMECSAKTGEGVPALSQRAARVALPVRLRFPHPKRGCTIS